MPPAGPQRRRNTCSIGLLVAFAALAAGQAPASASDYGEGTITFKVTNLPDGVSASSYFHADEVGKDKFVFDADEGNLEADAKRPGVATYEGITFTYKGDRAKTGRYQVELGASDALENRVVGTPTKFATLRGAKSRESGFGGTVTGAKVYLTSEGADHLNKVLGDRNGPFKAGPIGTLTAKFTRSTQEAEGGALALALDPALVGKLATKGVVPATGGIAVSAPATLTGTTPTFPFVGGKVGVNSDTGAVSATGGLAFVKTTALGNACDGVKPVGASFAITNPGVRLAFEVTGTAVPSTGAAPDSFAALSSRSLTATADAATRTVTQTAIATLTPDGASALNSAFGTTAIGCGTADFTDEDLLGKFTITAKVR